MVVIYRKIFNSGEIILWTVFVCFGDMLFDPSFFEFTLANWARGFIHNWYSCYALFLRSFTRFSFFLLFSYLYQIIKLKEFLLVCFITAINIKILFYKKL